MNVIYLTPFLLYFANTAFALTCYECDSSKNIACDYGRASIVFDTKDCAAGGGYLGNIIPSTCTKLVAKAKDGKEYIQRSCGVNTGPLNNCQLMAKALQFALPEDQVDTLDCFTCDTDKCNSASALKTFTLVGVITACLLYFL